MGGLRKVVMLNSREALGEGCRRFPISAADSVAIWGGIECSVTRVRDDYHDQFDCSGHFGRLEDLDLVAELGVSALRYPLIWEHACTRCGFWECADKYFGRLRSLHIDPIAGLVHHGSGPAHTNLLDDRFAEGLAEHALNVARRYPWITMYNPVNEPLTTARFSALYGFWYPHHRDSRSFIVAVMNQCKAIRAAMRAIRSVNPKALLVQTEDIGRTYSTPLLAYQAEFDNHRRWLTLDILAGQFTPEHPLWDYVMGHGVPEDDFKSFIDDPCPPDIVGINSYVTSERFLDERLHLYPQRSHGGNGRHAYADVSAVRVSAHGILGVEGILLETWDRYELPVAITEAHLGCTRDEQVRWLMEVWNAAVSAKERGLDVRAVTAWSLFGAYDWNSLLTRKEKHYEPGAFDLRAPRPRPTALSRCIQSLADSGEYDDPVLDEPGWWRRPDRLIYEPAVPHGSNASAELRMTSAPTRRKADRHLVISGATGTLGRVFARICEQRALPFRLLSRRDCDICDATQLRDIINETKPWAFINTAGYVRVDAAEGDRDRCFRENTTGPGFLAEACRGAGIPLVTFSSDLVFNGEKTGPYVESDPLCPLNIYGESKARAEREVLAAWPSSLVIRTSAFFGPWDDYNFIAAVRRQLARGEPFVAANDVLVSPTFVVDLVNVALDLLIDGERGIWHLANAGAITWADLALRVAAEEGWSSELVIGKPASEMGLPARRPRSSVLGSERGWLMPSLEDALGRFWAELKPAEAAAAAA